MARDDVRTSTVAIIGLLGAILTFAVILLLMVVYYHAEVDQDYRKNVSQPDFEVENVLADQQAKLVEYRWVDQEKKIVAIPIDRAMGIVVRELSSGTPAEPQRKEPSSVSPQQGSTEGRGEQSDEQGQ
ncbi:MAG: hypothetical protein ACYTG0_07090 [Planctomycetota bacterium]|jgi:hypothetical protein